jgi:hypothetical protein
VGIEKGLFQYYWQKGGMPSFDNIIKIQKGTGCSLDWLLTGQAPAVDDALERLDHAPCDPDEAKRRRDFVASARKMREVYSRQSPENIRALEVFVEILSKP